GQALSLDGSAEANAVQLANNTAFDFGSNDFTIQVWAKFNSAPDDNAIENLLEKFSGEGGPGWTLLGLDGALQFYAAPTVVLNTGPVTIAAGVWQEFVVERSGDTFNLYWDGNLVASSTSSDPLTASPNPLLFGARNSEDGRNYTLDGSIDN